MQMISMTSFESTLESAWRSSSLVSIRTDANFPYTTTDLKREDRHIVTLVPFMQELPEVLNDPDQHFRADVMASLVSPISPPNVPFQPHLYDGFCAEE